MHSFRNPWRRGGLVKFRYSLQYPAECEALFHAWYWQEKGRTVLLRLLIVLLVLCSTTIPLSAVAQDTPDPEATIAALQTEVAELQGASATATPATAATPDDQPQEMAPASES